MMHTPEEINAAVTLAVKTALQNAAMVDTMLANGMDLPNYNCWFLPLGILRH